MGLAFAGIPIPLGQLNIAHDGGEDIVEVVGDPTGEGPQGLEALAMAHLILQQQPFLFGALHSRDIYPDAQPPLTAALIIGQDGRVPGHPQALATVAQTLRLAGNIHRRRARRTLIDQPRPHLLEIAIPWTKEHAQGASDQRRLSITKGLTEVWIDVFNAQVGIGLHDIAAGMFHQLAIARLTLAQGPLGGDTRGNHLIGRVGDIGKLLGKQPRLGNGAGL